MFINNAINSPLSIHRSISTATSPRNHSTYASINEQRLAFSAVLEIEKQCDQVTAKSEIGIGGRLKTAEPKEDFWKIVRKMDLKFKTVGVSAFAQSGNAERNINKCLPKDFPANLGNALWEKRWTWTQS
jgi:hypothetical protein